MKILTISFLVVGLVVLNYWFISYCKSKDTKSIDKLKNINTINLKYSLLYKKLKPEVKVTKKLIKRMEKLFGSNSIRYLDMKNLSVKHNRKGYNIYSILVLCSSLFLIGQVIMLLYIFDLRDVLLFNLGNDKYVAQNLSSILLSIIVMFLVFALFVWITVKFIDSIFIPTIYTIFSIEVSKYEEEIIKTNNIYLVIATIFIVPIVPLVFCILYVIRKSYIEDNNVDEDNITDINLATFHYALVKHNNFDMKLSEEKITKILDKFIEVEKYNKGKSFNFKKAYVTMVLNDLKMDYEFNDSLVKMCDNLICEVNYESLYEFLFDDLVPILDEVYGMKKVPHIVLNDKSRLYTNVLTNIDYDIDFDLVNSTINDIEI